MNRIPAMCLRTCALALALLLTSIAQGGGISAEVGLDALAARVGLANLPTGATVIVGHVEAPEGSNGYGPDQALSEFAGKTFTAMSGGAGASGHATLVGQNFYGGLSSIAPGITNIFLYNANGWVTGNYLQGGAAGSVAPVLPPAGLKVMNNSWIGAGTGVDNDILRRADYAADRDEILIISGANNGGVNPALMSHMYNGIAVGLTSGTHAWGPTSGGGLDGAGRMKPEIVAPGGFTSFATPVVSAAGALLIHTARTFPGLTTNINAQRSDTLRAILLAGGNHRPGWTNNPSTSGANRGLTTTPLDVVYGVDVVNINNSHLIMTGLEQTGGLTTPAAFNSRRGWDQVSIAVNASRHYKFHVKNAADKVSILASWQRLIGSNFTQTVVADFDLILRRLDSNGVPQSLLGSAGAKHFDSGNVESRSSVDNLEHLYIVNLQPGDYALEIKRMDIESGSRDVCVAWLLPPTAGDVNGDGFVDVNDLLAVVGAWGACLGCVGDLTGDGVIDVNDLLMVVGNWG